MKSLKLMLICVLLPWNAFAWHGNGHMTAGAIAYYYLKSNDPAILTKVLATLKLHPWYGQQHWNDTLAALPPDQQDVALFMLASTYPDDARDFPNLGGGDYKLWHYIDYPFIPPGQSVTSVPAPLPNAQEKINGFISSLPGEAESPQKAVDLAWLFHLIEDVHQPLHTATMFDNNHPTGDGGGNLTFIKISSGPKLVLHWYWDDLVKGTLTTFPANAQTLLAESQYAESNLPELTTNTTPDQWIVNESYPDAKTYAYLDGKVNGTRANPTILTPSYDEVATKLGERRVVLAGIRLAKMLIKVYS